VENIDDRVYGAFRIEFKWL